MTQDFMQNAPVGTKIFNKKNKLHYVKVEKDGTSFWKVQRGSRLGRLTIGDTSADNYGTAVEYVDNKKELQIKHSGDNIPDYLQTRGITTPNRNKFYTSDKDIIIKDGKFFTAGGKEIPKHKIQKGSIYHIDSGESVVGKQLKSELNRSEALHMYNRGRQRYDYSTGLIEKWSKRPGDTYFSGRQGGESNTYAEAVEFEKKNRKRYSKYSMPFDEYYNSIVLGNTDKAKNELKIQQTNILGEKPSIEKTEQGVRIEPNEEINLNKIRIPGYE